MAENETLSPALNEEIRISYIRSLIIVCIITAIVIPVCGILDIFKYPENLKVLLFIRAVVIIPLIAAVLLLRSNENVRKHAVGLSTILFFEICLGMALIIRITGGYNSPHYLVPALIVLILSLGLNIPVKRTILVSFIAYLFYMVPALILADSVNLPVFFNKSLIFIAVTTFAVCWSFMQGKIWLREYIARHKVQEAKEELERIDKMKSQFFANISHEVRTPLTSIIAPVQSLYQGDVGKLEDEQQQMIGQVYRNTLRLLDLINQMLDFSKIEAGQMILRLGKINIEEMMCDIVAIFEEVAARRGVTLTFTKKGEIPEIKLDRDKMERILTNLIRNSIKFTETGSINLSASIDGNTLVIDVEDTGIGIPYDYLSHIFERFRQVDPSSTRRFEGTGLGLTIVKESVDLMHGSISVYSNEGEGTRFRIGLPMNLEELATDATEDRRSVEKSAAIESGAKEKEPAGEKRRRRDPAKVTMEDIALFEDEPKIKDENEDDEKIGEKLDNVLLVEDNDDLRGYISKMLRKFGHRVWAVSDGMEAWLLAQQLTPDVVVSDIMMPNMDGYGLLKELRKDPRTKNIPVILMTAKSEKDARIEGLEKGADDYLPKPIDVRELDVRVRNMAKMRKDQKIEVLENMIDEKSLLLAQCTEMRDSITAGHSKDVLNLGKIAARQMGINVSRIFRESLLHHDIGKIKIPDVVLLKKGRLTDEEYAIIKKHPEYGAELFKGKPGLDGVSENILAHQERFDGKGYPRGLKGSEIPLIARIIAAVDTYHVITNERPYKKALAPKEAIKELIKFKGTQFDPIVVDAFIKGLLKERLITKADITEAQEDIPKKK